MGSIVKELEMLYLKSLEGIEERVTKYNASNNGNLDGPFLMSTREELYKNAKIKILFVGQESYRLEDKDKQKSYERIKLMENNLYVIEQYHNNSPFWRTLFSVNESLNPGLEGRCCFFWTNVSKYSNDGGPITSEEHEFIVEQTKNILIDEIKIIKPDVIIFFSGPRYDDKIRIQFDERLSFEEVDCNVPIRKLARLKHPLLPERTFRTYHPGARVKDKQYYIHLILGYCLGCDLIGLLNDFKIQLNEMAIELKLEVEFNPNLNLGEVYSGFYFSNPEWRYIRIGFEFEKVFGDFFGGICKKDWDKPMPENILNSIQYQFETFHDQTENWPYWFWVDEQRNWNRKTFEEVENGKFILKIKAKLEEILVKLEEQEL